MDAPSASTTSTAMSTSRMVARSMVTHWMKSSKLWASSKRRTALWMRCWLFMLLRALAIISRVACSISALSDFSLSII